MNEELVEKVATDIKDACRDKMGAWPPPDVAKIMAKAAIQATGVMEMREALEFVLDWNDGTPPLGDEPWLEMAEVARLALGK